MTATFRHDSPGTPAASWLAHAGRVGVEDVLDGFDRLVVVAAHPDDESLGAAGLASQAVRTGLRIDLLVATAGEHSHPGSPTTSPQTLATLRRTESQQAWEIVGGGVPIFLDLEDGTLCEHEADLTSQVVDLVGDGRNTLIAAPWRHDRHPDHEAAGRAAAAAARRTGASLLEYPIWLWHWGDPQDAPWSDVVGVALTSMDLRRKRAAIAAHRTQVEPLSALPGDERLLSDELIDHFTSPTELYVRQSPHDAALDRLHAATEDPWGADDRWYEQRKRTITTALLPRPRFAAALEVGCSTGALAADLADRCDRLVAVDASPTAVAQAHRRLRDRLHVSTRVLDVPDEWPEESFDLIVISEVAYFLSPVALEELARRVAETLRDDGCVLLCHWRHPVEGWVLDGPTAHRELCAALGLDVVGRYRDRDIEVLVLGDADNTPDPAA